MANKAYKQMRWKQEADYLRKKGELVSATNLYEAAGEWKLAGDTYMQRIRKGQSEFSNYEGAAKDYEKAGKLTKAKTIREKVKKLRKRREKEGGLAERIKKILGLTVLLIGLYLTSAVMRWDVNQSSLINFILVCIVGLVCYSYLK